MEHITRAADFTGVLCFALKAAINLALDVLNGAFVRSVDEPTFVTHTQSVAAAVTVYALHRFVAQWLDVGIICLAIRACVTGFAHALVRRNAFAVVCAP